MRSISRDCSRPACSFRRTAAAAKAWALRRVLEQTAPHVQQLVIDPEGEFATLREKFDYIMCAPHDGDAMASPQTAALLGRRLLETGVSAILDIYDLKAHERQSVRAPVPRRAGQRSEASSGIRCWS
jgi:hypothetical protein